MSCMWKQKVFFFFFSINIPIISKLNLAAIPSIAANNPQLKLFSKNSRTFNSINSKNYTYSYLYSFFHVLYNHSPLEEHLPTHMLRPPTPRAAPVARGVANRTPSPPPRLRPQSLFSANKHSNYLPKIRKLNFKVFPPITTNNPQPELFFPNFRIFYPKK